jgi:hypothetical protein
VRVSAIRHQQRGDLFVCTGKEEKWEHTMNRMVSPCEFVRAKRVPKLRESGERKVNKEQQRRKESQ